MQTTQPNNTKIKKLPVFDSNKELEKFLETNLTESLKQFIRVTVSSLVKAEMREVKQQFEQLTFNGYYDRTLTSLYGKVEDIPVPRFRQGLPTDQPLRSLSVFEIEQERFHQLIGQMHALGISQRKISRLAKDCLGIKLSKNAVGSIHKDLATREEANINNKPIVDEFIYLYVDGIWAVTKGYGWDNNKSVTLCALGVKANGERTLLGFLIARAEDEESCQKFIGSLKQRGLIGENLKLIIMDDSAGLKAGVATFYPTIPIQNCITHKIRNVLRKTSHKNKRAMADDLKIIFAAKTKDQALELAKSVVKKWYQNEGRATESLKHNIEYCFTYLEFPVEEWSKVRTTNPLERSFREVRRRTKVFDNTFQNPESADRYFNSIFTNLNATYPQQVHTH